MNQLTKYREDYPLYQKAVQAYLANDSRTFFKLKASKVISTPERNLLEARALFRENKWDDARILLQKSTFAVESFLDAERYFLLASSYFFGGDFEMAVDANLKAASIYHSLQDRRGKFLSLHNAMVDFSRLGHAKLAKSYFEQAQAIASGDAECLLLERALACEASQSERHEEACFYIEQALKRVKQMTVPDQQSLTAIAADTFFRAGRIEQAHSLLRDEKLKHSKHRERGRLDFYFAVLQALHKNISLGAMPSSIREFPEVELKWKLLVALQSGDQERASRLWQKLHELIPAYFGNDFDCLDQGERKSVFWTYLSKIKNTRFVESVPDTYSGKLKTLYHVLKTASGPIRKEDLIEKIWKTSYDLKMDSRLYKLIERAKQNKIPIVNLNRAYALSQVLEK